MKRKVRRRFLAGAISALLILGAAPAESAEAVEPGDVSESSWQTCTVYSGNNVEDQNYLRATSPIRSYLTTAPEGGLMRVQAGAVDGILVEYYNADYQLTGTKTIPAELPIFGGFCESDSNYYLLTGQNNPDESKEVEVYRITKYDKEWNRIKSVGLYDCNTTAPFDAGSARMDTSGKYLLIRTCHEMYTSSDGKNHQANVTIQVDMDTMTITDSYTDVMNSSYGYVSHSFNQFIKIENKQIVAVDHGDAYPRAIALIKYQTDVSQGTFVPGYRNPCKVVNVLKFPGGIGVNTTGASVGGFEISSSSYLVGGNSVVQDSENLSRTTRNVFVASVDKNTDEVTMNWLTQYNEGDGTTSTPQMVKISDNQYMVLWSRNHTVYYTMVDGNGKQSGTTYEISGSLSDCVPSIANNKLVWYVWDDETITFYEISLSDPAQTQTKVIKNGHEYENQGVEDEYAILKCIHCDEVQKVKVPTSMNVWWNDQGGSGSYYSRFKNPRNVNDELYYWVVAEPSDADKQIEVSVADPEIISCEPSSASMGKLTALKPGKTTITIRSKYNPEVVKNYDIMVNGELSVDSFTADKASPQKVGTTVTLSAEAIGGDWNYTYKFYEKDENGKETIIRDFADDANCVWIPATAGTRSLWVDVKDGEGTIATKSMDYEVTRLELTASDFTFTPPAQLTYDGQAKLAQIAVNEGIEGAGAITMKYYDSEGNIITGAPEKAGTYTVKIDVSEGTRYSAANNLTDASWTFAIGKATDAPKRPAADMTVSHGLKTVGAVALPANWQWAENDRSKALAAGESVSGTAEYIGSDKDNYENITVVITIAADGHTGGTATCVEKAVCTVCQQEYGEYNRENHTGNTVIKNAKEATCQAKGYTGDTYCKDCDTLLAEGTDIETTAHDFGEWVTVPSSCTSGGSRQRTCKTCGYIDKEDLGIAAHEWEDDYTIDQEATCTEDGSESIHCKNCDATKDARTIEKLGHSFTEYVSNNDADCTEDGTKTAKCDRCDATDTVTDVGSRLGHDFKDYVSNNDATCTKDGTKTAQCSRCDAKDTIAEEGTMIPHKGGTATCSSKAVCEMCGGEYGEIDKNNHVGGTEVKGQKDATCAAEGYTGDTYCKGCGDLLYKGTSIDKTAHQYGEWETVDTENCETGGSKMRVCKVCGYTQTKNVDPAGHDWDTEYTIDKEATCTEDGSKSIHCKNCQVIKDSEVIPAFGHSFLNYVSDGNATCKEDGTKTATCERCDATDTVIDQGSRTNDHIGGTATCTELAKCEVCGVAYGQLDSMNHAGEKETRNVKAATCTEKGYTGDVYCLDCNRLVEKGHDVTELGHDFGEWETVTSPNCSDKGSEQRVCKVCGVTETRDVQAEGHTWNTEYTVDVEPTCTEDGSKSVHCTKCDVTKDSEVVPALGHDFETYTSNGDATCTEDGTKTAKCERCDAIETVSDIGSKLGHKGGAATCVQKAVCEVCGQEYGEVDLKNHIGQMEIRNYREATCQAAGYTGDEFCSECNTLVTLGKTIDKLEHKYKDGKCTVCGAKQSDKNGGNVATGGKGNKENTGDKGNRTVKTGDEADVGLCLMMALLALAVALTIERKKKVR